MALPFIRPPRANRFSTHPNTCACWCGVLLFSFRIDRFDAHERARVFAGQQVQVAVRTLTNVANALLELNEHRFAMELLPLVVEIEPLQMAGPRHFALPHAADEEIVFPAR